MKEHNPADAFSVFFHPGRTGTLRFWTLILPTQAPSRRALLPSVGGPRYCIITESAQLWPALRPGAHDACALNVLSPFPIITLGHAAADIDKFAVLSIVRSQHSERLDTRLGEREPSTFWFPFVMYALHFEFCIGARRTT